MLHIYRIFSRINNKPVSLTVQKNVRLADRTKTLPNTRYLIADADLSTKEDYLRWVASWKEAVKALESIIREVKAARKPATIPDTQLFKDCFDGWYIPKDKREMFQGWTLERKLSDFNGQRTESLQLLKQAATELYRARRNYKLASAMAGQQKKI